MKRTLQVVVGPPSAIGALQVLVLDEARVLCNIPCTYLPKQRRNAFELFRKALHAFCAGLSAGHRLVVIVADTSSSIGNFAPQLDALPGHIREIDVAESMVSQELFPVVHLPLYFDVFAPAPFRHLDAPPTEHGAW
jgi:hypothetical protein